MKLVYDISELIPYINWPYFFFAWQVKETGSLRLSAAVGGEIPCLWVI